MILITIRDLEMQKAALLGAANAKKVPLCNRTQKKAEIIAAGLKWNSKKKKSPRLKQIKLQSIVYARENVDK